MNLLQPATYSRASTSLSIFGPGGSGKSLTAILIAIGNSIERRNRAGIALVDPEDVSDFLLRICEIEGVPLFTMKRRTFVEMRDALKEAEDAGLSAFVVDHYDGIHRELIEAQKDALDLRGHALPYQHREELIRHWDDWVRRVRASSCDCLFNGRLAWNWGDDENESGDAVKVRLGTKMRGDGDADYEPDLLIEMELIERRVREQKSHAKRIENLHFAYVRKDRTQALSGMQFQWKDLHGYKKGDYQAVWKHVAPYFAQFAPDRGLSTRAETGEPVRSSGELFAKPRRDTAFAERAKRITIAVEEIQAALAALWPGQSAEDKRMRAIVTETIFKSRSWTAIESMLPETVEAGWRIMQTFETAATDKDEPLNVRDEAAVVACIQSCKDLESERQANVSVGF